MSFEKLKPTQRYATVATWWPLPSRGMTFPPIIPGKNLFSLFARILVIHIYDWAIRYRSKICNVVWVLAFRDKSYYGWIKGWKKFTCMEERKNRIHNFTTNNRLSNLEKMGCETIKPRGFLTINRENKLFNFIWSNWSNQFRDSIIR